MMGPDDYFSGIPRTRASIPTKSASTNKNGYELRAEMLSLSWDMIKYQLDKGSRTSITTEDVINNARRLYDFVNENPTRKI